MSEKFKKALRIAVNVGCGFEGDAEDAAELLTLITGLETRIAELEAKIRHNALWQASEDAEERAHLEKLVPDLKKRIAELERDFDMLFRAVIAASKQSRKNTQTQTFVYGKESEE